MNKFWAWVSLVFAISIISMSTRLTPTQDELAMMGFLQLISLFISFLLLDGIAAFLILEVISNVQIKKKV